MGAEPFLSGSFDDSSGANLDLHDLAESGVGDSYAERGTLSKRTVKASVLNTVTPPWLRKYDAKRNL